jgi:hypothetical protein
MIRWSRFLRVVAHSMWFAACSSPKPLGTCSESNQDPVACEAACRKEPEGASCLTLGKALGRIPGASVEASAYFHACEKAVARACEKALRLGESDLAEASMRQAASLEGGAPEDLQLVLAVNSSWMERQAASAHRACAQGNCSSEFALDLANPPLAFAALQKLCTAPSGQRLGTELTPKLVRLGTVAREDIETDGYLSDCDFLRLVQAFMSERSSACQGGESLGCWDRDELLRVLNPPAYVLSLQSRTHQKSAAKAPVPWQSILQVVDAEPRQGRALLAQLARRLAFLRAFGREPQRGECQPGYGGCHPTTAQDFERARKRARILLTSVASSQSSAITEALLVPAFAEILPRLLDCYEDGLGSNPTVQGALGVRLVADAEGRILAAASQNSTVPDRTLVECEVRRVSALRVPGAWAGSPVTLTIELQPQ